MNAACSCSKIIHIILDVFAQYIKKYKWKNSKKKLVPLVLHKRAIDICHTRSVKFGTNTIFFSAFLYSKMNAKIKQIFTYLLF